MTQLSVNFSLHEFACRHCGRTVIDHFLVDRLQRMRDLVDRPIIITSGYRCAEHPIEKAKGPDYFGPHRRGIAADIICPQVSLQFLLANALGVFHDGGVGFYPDKKFIHVDIGDRRRWGQLNGHYCGFEEAIQWWRERAEREKPEEPERSCRQDEQGMMPTEESHGK